GAIYATSAVTFGQDGDFEAGYGVYTFSNNLCYYEGGAIFASGNTTLNGKSFTFSNNTAENWVGGAIRLYASNELNLTLNGETTFTGNTAGAGGGAIYTRGVITANQFATFENNTSASSGGAIYAQGSESIQGSVAFNKGVTFSGNTAVQNGGAIYAYGSVTFAGDGSEGTFTNNVSNNGVGNDLYLVNASSILTFQDAGTYSFDGGIYLNNAAAQTVINQAQVTIAGREGDDTNVYQLQNVNISNGGKLSAQLDNINSLAGNFTISDTPTEVALSWVGQTATIKSSTGYKSSFELVYGSIDPNLNSLDITSGRLDIKGDLTSSLTVKERATFSPGNSVGTLFLDGDFTAEPWSTLFIEQDENGIDQLIVRSGGTVNIDDNAVLELLMTNPVPNATYTIIDSEDGLTGKYATSDFWNGLLTSGSAYYWNMSVDGNKVYATIDPNAVPEPSTWALLILGAMGLLYWRNKN
ncbi:MAG: PEP-CTERM sorting domain-containing protein, partial [Thermoguttaceae bacterium]|nr:PEP-CTERM sorting domain-containing protein [Thermoguttaceae bacterium]